MNFTHEWTHLFSFFQWSVNALPHNNENKNINRVWRRSERFKDDCVKEVKHGHGGSVMVWGGITDVDRRTKMVILNGHLITERYINDVLQPVVVPFVDDKAAIYSGSQSRPSVFGGAKTRAIGSLASPLAWYEPHGGHMEPTREGRKRANPAWRHPSQELSWYLTEEWRNLPQDRIHRVVATMRRRRTALTVMVAQQDIDFKERKTVNK